MSFTFLAGQHPDRATRRARALIRAQLRRHAFRLNGASADALWEGLDRARMRRDMLQANAQPYADSRDALRAIAEAAEAIVKNMEQPDVRFRLDHRAAVPAEIIQHLAQAARAEHEQLITAHRLKARAQDGTLKALSDAFQQAIGKRATASTNEEAVDEYGNDDQIPYGPFVDFVLSAFFVWGEEITPTAIKGALYRGRPGREVTPTAQQR